MYGDHPQLFQSMNIVIMCLLLMFSLDIHGFFPIQTKSDVMQTFLQVQVMVERLLNHKIISVQFDWGGEYRNVHKYFQSIGITHRSLALTRINNKDVLNVNTYISLTPR
jgi:hypothetical protein